MWYVAIGFAALVTTPRDTLQKNRFSPRVIVEIGAILLAFYISLSPVMTVVDNHRWDWVIVVRAAWELFQLLREIDTQLARASLMLVAAAFLAVPNFAVILLWNNRFPSRAVRVLPVVLLMTALGSIPFALIGIWQMG